MALFRQLDEQMRQWFPQHLLWALWVAFAVCRVCSWLKQQSPRQQSIVINDLGITCNDLMTKEQWRGEF